VAGEDDGHALPGLAEERLGQGVDADRVEPGEGFVEDEDLGAADQRGGELDALLVAQRQLLHRVPATGAEPETLDPLVGRPACGTGVQTVQPGEVGDLLADLHLRVEPALLRHVSDPAAAGLVQ
jgi:hypothetical protein